MTDYARLLDPEIRAFIDRTNGHYPPDAAERPVEDQRRVYDAMCRAFGVGRPGGVAVEEGTVEGPDGPVPVRRYRAAAGAPARVLYLHGGGFVVGGLDSHDEICAELCMATGFPVTAADYRLAPEHVHPAAFADSLAAFRAEAARGLPVVLAGDSAGGNLAAAIAHATRGEAAAPIGQVLVYPGLGGDPGRGSGLVHAHAPMLSRADLDFYRTVRTGGAEPDPGDPTLAPLADRDFSGLPPTVAIAAECDPLADDCAAYAARIRAAGGLAMAWEEPGLVHGWLRARHMSGRARAAFWRFAQAVLALGRREWPWAPG